MFAMCDGSCVQQSLSRRPHSWLRFSSQRWRNVSSSAYLGKRIRHGGSWSIPLPCDGGSHLRSGFKTIAKFQSTSSKDFVSYTEIEQAASRQGLALSLETLGPFFRVEISDAQSKEVLGAAHGVVKLWTCGRLLHLDSVRLSPTSLITKRPIFGIAFLLGAVAIRHGYDQNCVKAELLAIKDTETLHSRLVRYYTRMGFKSVYDVTGESLQDMPHMLIWGGVGTRMDASIEELLVKWSPALKKAAM